jgi:UTP--glucose-1-phosphate uridylyltransferase
MKIGKAVIPAGGRGVRLLPASKAIPKEMFPVLDKPVLQFVVEEAVDSGVSELLLVTNPQKPSIEKHFTNDPLLEEFLSVTGKNKVLDLVRSISQSMNLSVVHQDSPLGLGHAVLQAKNFVGDDFFAVLLADDIMFGEIPVLRQLIDTFQQQRGAVIAVMEVPWETVSEYGILRVEPCGEDSSGLFRVKSVVEKPERRRAPSNLAIMGRYILPSRIFRLLEQTTPGALGEIQLTDGIQALIDEGEPVFASRFEGERYEVGDPLAYLKANVEIALKDSRFRDEFLEYLRDRIV